MSDVKIKTSIDQNSHYQDRKQNTATVDIEDEESVKKWANVLHMTTEELIVAVNTFGPVVSDIRRGMNKQQAA